MKWSHAAMIRRHPGAGPIPFPRAADSPAGQAPDQAGSHLLSALEGMSRKIDDLARALDCLGFFDDDADDRPRAA